MLALLSRTTTADGFLEPAALLDAGAQVGAYRIERILGRGGMGVVYSRRHAAASRRSR